MTDELNRYLDDEVGDDALTATARTDAEAWDRMVESFRSAAPRAAAPPWLEQNVMRDIEALPSPGRLGRALHWLTNPTPVRVSPLATGLVVAAFALVLLLPQTTPGPRSDPTSGLARGTPGATTTAEDAASVVYVQFVLEAPGATSVSLAGDFSDWEASVTLADQNADGFWTARVPVRPGVYGYMFLIDGTEWKTDPRADRYQDDGFGNRNAVLAVAASE